MKYQDCKRKRGKHGEYGKHGKHGKHGWMSAAIAGAAMLAAAASGGCLYPAIPSMAGPSTNYHAPADNQPAQPAQPSNDPATQNKQQNGTPQNGAPPQGQGGATTP